VLAVEVAVSWVTLTNETRLSSHGRIIHSVPPELRGSNQRPTQFSLRRACRSSIRARQNKAEALQARVAQLLWRHQGEEDAPGGARRTGRHLALPLDPMNRSPDDLAATHCPRRRDCI